MMVAEGFKLSPSSSVIESNGYQPLPKPFFDEHLNETKVNPQGDHSLLYFAYTCIWDLFIGGVIYLAKKIIR
jgi:hypothetical protein